jgi:hypothetical protein
VENAKTPDFPGFCVVRQTAVNPGNACHPFYAPLVAKTQPSLLQAVLSLYVAEVEKDVGFGDPGAVQQAIDFNAQFTVLFGINIAPLIELLADANVAEARGGAT